MEDLAPLRDEGNEPLGLLPGLGPRPVARKGWMILPLAAPAAVAVAMAAFTFGRHDAEPRGEWLAARTEAPAAPLRAEPTPAPSSAGVDTPALPPIATADQVEAASGVKVTRGAARARLPRSSSTCSRRSPPRKRRLRPSFSAKDAPKGRAGPHFRAKVRAAGSAGLSANPEAGP
ncbi:MAG TPA: hypothetical protein VJY34_21735 [Roseiarcus sp.]|nr:hypothetical protein [Roseiarcus sp.]